MAIKFPRGGQVGSSSSDTDRFLREARSVAQLRHPSIVSIHEVGQHVSLPYLVADFVAGITLAEDLRSWLAGEPIRARPVSTLERGWSWVKRRPAMAALLLISSIAALLLVGGTVSLWYQQQLQQELGKTQQAKGQAEAFLLQARQAKVEAEANLDRAEYYQYFHHIALSHAGWQDGNLSQLEQLLENCPSDRRHWEWNYLKRLSRTEILTLQATHGIWTWRVAFNPKGTRLASASIDGTVRVWAAAIDQETVSLQSHAVTVRGIAFSPDGTRLAAAGNSGVVTIWDARPVTAETPMEYEARGIVEHLFAKPLRRVDVVDYVQTTPTLRPKARDLALMLAQQDRAEVDPERYHHTAWNVVRQPFLNTIQYDFALRQARAEKNYVRK